MINMNVENNEMKDIETENIDVENNQYESEKKKLPKRNIVLYVSIIVIVVSITFRTSYAFYLGYVNNAKEPTPTVVESGALELKFANDVKYLNVEDLSIMTAADAAVAENNYSSFSVINNGTLSAKYKLYLSNYSLTENLVDADFKWKLTIDGVVYTGTFYDLFNGKTSNNGVIESTTDDIALISNDITLAPNSTHNCEFRVWLQEADRNQINLTDGTFRTTIRLMAVNN